MKNQILALAQELFAEIRQIRRHLHQHPELSFKEYKTAEYLANLLDDWHLDPKTTAETGLLADLVGDEPGPIIVLRADIDALPVKEMSGLSFASVNEGIMHACGHDMHTASLLGSLRILQAMRGEIKGTVRFLFQPGEELLPGGAQKVLESGILNSPLPDAMIAQHVFPELPAGFFGFRPGQYMASTDEIYIEVEGTGGHGGMPHKLVDPVLIASHLLVNLQQIVSRKTPPDIPTVLSFGKFDAPGATNVIPQKVWLEGTFRTLNEDWRAEAHEEIRRNVEGIVSGMGAKATVRIVSGYPSLFNDQDLTDRAISLSQKFGSEEQTKDLSIRMTGEDFARYSQHYPAVFYRWGTGYPGRENYPVHHPQFEANEEALIPGMGFMAYLALTLFGD